MPRLSVLIYVLSLFILTACANPAADRALQAQKVLVGMPREALSSCAGEPINRVMGNLDFEALTYENVGMSYTQEGHPYFGLYGWRDHTGYGTSVPFDRTSVTSTGCSATFTLRDGVVRQLTYSPIGPGPLPLDMCYAIVRNCLLSLSQP